MEAISTYLTRFAEKDKKSAPHEQAAKVDEILKIVKLTPRYNYKYWLRKVKKRSFGDVMSICKDASNLPSKYNVGGYITNKLCYKKNTTSSQENLNLFEKTGQTQKQVKQKES